MKYRPPIRVTASPVMPRGGRVLSPGEMAFAAHKAAKINSFRLKRRKHSKARPGRLHGLVPLGMCNMPPIFCHVTPDALARSDVWKPCQS